MRIHHEVGQISKLLYSMMLQFNSFLILNFELKFECVGFEKKKNARLDSIQSDINRFIIRYASPVLHNIRRTRITSFTSNLKSNVNKFF